MASASAVDKRQISLQLQQSRRWKVTKPMMNSNLAEKSPQNPETENVGEM